MITLLTRDRKFKIVNSDLPFNNDACVIKVLYCGICGSDIKIYKSGNSRVTFPATLGHEVVGRIERINEQVGQFLNLKKGDVVVVGSDYPCGECFYCKRGDTNNCERALALGYQMPGGFQDYIQIPNKEMYMAPIKKIESNNIRPYSLTEPLACVVNAFRKLNYTDKSRLLIIGGGTLGTLAALYARSLGIEDITINDININRFILGATLFGDLFRYNKNKRDLKKEHFDIIFIANSNPKAQIQALNLAKKGTTIHFFGGLTKEHKVELDLNKLHYEEITLTGSHGSTYHDFVKAYNVISMHEDLFDRVITHEHKLTNIEDAFNSVMNLNGLKHLIKLD